eukprot:scaffold4719_cov314-Pinguiococcus_pyrenoidosus.AAC.1
MAQRGTPSPARLHLVVWNRRAVSAGADPPRERQPVVPTVVAGPALLGHQQRQVVLVRQQMRLIAHIRLDGRGRDLPVADVDVCDGLPLGVGAGGHCGAAQVDKERQAPWPPNILRPTSLEHLDEKRYSAMPVGVRPWQCAARKPFPGGTEVHSRKATSRAARGRRRHFGWTADER